MKRFAIWAATVLWAGSVGMGWAALDFSTDGNAKAQGSGGTQLTTKDKAQITGNLSGDAKHLDCTLKGKANAKGAVKASAKNSFIKSNGFQKQNGLTKTGTNAAPNLPAVHN